MAYVPNRFSKALQGLRLRVNVRPEGWYPLKLKDRGCSYRPYFWDGENWKSLERGEEEFLVGPRLEMPE